MENLGAVLQAQDKIRRYETSHLLHLILSVLTAGIWIPFWILTTVSNSIERAKGDSMMNRAINGTKKKQTNSFDYKKVDWVGLFLVSFVLVAIAVFVSEKM